MRGLFIFAALALVVAGAPAEAHRSNGRHAAKAPHAPRSARHGKSSEDGLSASDRALIDAYTKGTASKSAEDSLGLSKIMRKPF